MSGAVRVGRILRRAAGFVIPILLLVSLATPVAHAGLDSAYRSYKKAEAKLEARAYDEALVLVERAITQHATSQVFKMGIQTRHYFPYYLRGVIRLRMGDSKAAAEDFQFELDAEQIQTVDSMHARLLNALEEAEALDTEQPVVRVDDIEILEFGFVQRGNQEIEQVTLRLVGSAVDADSGITSISVAGQEIALVAEEGTHRFDAIVTVDATATSLELIVRDAADNVGTVEQPLNLPPLDLGESAENIHAVIVGVNEYDKSYRADDGDCNDEVRAVCGNAASFKCYSLPDLNFAANDADRFARLLLRRGVPAENIEVLVSRDGNLAATREKVLEHLRRLENIQVGKVIFFFSGHGVLSERQDNLMLLSDTRGWECAQPEEDKPTVLEETALGVNEVAQLMLEIPAKERYLILDACRSPQVATKAATGQPAAAGFSATGIKGLSLVRVEQAEDRGADPVIFYSTLEKKVSVEWNRKSSGYFTWFLLQGLRQDLPLDGLKRYVQEQVRRQTREDLCSADLPESSCPYYQAPYLQLPKSLEQDYDLQSRTYILK